MKKTKNESYTHLKYFGIPKLIPFLKPYKKRLLTMLLLGIGGPMRAQPFLNKDNEDGG